MDLRVTVVGGTGFIGLRLVERLIACGARVRIVSRRAQGNHGSARQAEHVTGSIDKASTIERAVDRATAVVNLVGTTAAKREQGFYALHRDGPRRLAEAARRASGQRFVHGAAIGLALGPPST